MMRSDPWTNPRRLLAGDAPQAASKSPRTVEARPPGLIAYAPVAGAAAGLTLGILGLLKLGPEFLKRRPVTSTALCLTAIALLVRRTRL